LEQYNLIFWNKGAIKFYAAYLQLKFASCFLYPVSW